MEALLNKKKNNGIILCAILGFVTALVSFIYFVISGNGILTIRDDFNTQQLTFAQAVWNGVHGGGEWFWNLDLGSSLVNGFAFYNLGSPFFWIFLILPKGIFPYLVAPLYILKYTTACVTAYIYLRLFTKKTIESKVDYAIVGSLLYAFSGFQTVNLMFFHFHDVVAFFPLLLCGIEKIDDKKSRKWFILSIFISCMVNYFFFIQEVIFMIIYFLFRYYQASLKEKLHKLLCCMLCGVMGVGMASVLFIPSVIYIKGNPRSEVALFLKNLVFDSKAFLQIIKGILFPGDVMPANSAVVLQNWDSPSCYLPLFGISCVIVFIIKDRGWLRKLLIFLSLISAFPIMQSGFLLFTAVYQRWWFMFVLVMALATSKVLESPKEYSLSKGLVIYVAIATGLFLAIKYISWNANRDQLVFFEDRFTYYFALAVIGPLVLDILFRLNKLNFVIVVALTMIFCAFSTAITLNYYRNTDTEVYIERYNAALNLKALDDQYRYNTRDNVYTLISEAAGIGAFSSTIENSAHEFNELLEVDTNNSSQGRIKVPGLPQLLGGKYSITTDENAENIIDSVSCKNTTLYITEGKACPIGFAMDRYIYANELSNVAFDKRGVVLMNAAVILPKETTKVEPIMTHVLVSDIDFDKPIDDMAVENAAKAVSNFNRDSKGFRCTTDYDKDTIVYFSVPNDSGWTATIDEITVEIIDSCGMMLLKVPSGNHKIEFTYHTPGLKLGIIISSLFWAGFVAYCVYDVILSKKYGKENEA